MPVVCQRASHAIERALDERQVIRAQPDARANGPGASIFVRVICFHGSVLSLRGRGSSLTLGKNEMK